MFVATTNESIQKKQAKRQDMFFRKSNAILILYFDIYNIKKNTKEKRYI